MDTMKGLQALVRTIELGSLSAAARELGTSQPTVSKIVAALERQLEVRLVERSTTRLMPTEAGQRFHEHARRILEDWAEATATARGEATQAAGLLRVNAPLGFGEVHLTAIVRRFLDAHPGLQVELILDDRYVDLVEERVDLAIRLGGPLPATAVAQTLAQVPRFLVAAPAYLRRHAPIRRPEDLAGHEFVRFAWLAWGSTVELKGPRDAVHRVELAARYSVNSAIAVREAVRDGQGLALAPAWLVQEWLADGRLVRVLPRWSADGQALRVVYPSRRYQPLRTRLFMGFLADALRGLPGLQPPAPDAPDRQSRLSATSARRIRP